MTTIENFVDILLKVISYADDQVDLIKKISINEFIEGSIDFQKLVEIVEKYSQENIGKNDDMLYLHGYAKYVKGIVLTEDSVPQLKELLKEAIAPPKIDKIEGDTVLEVLGNNIIMSDIIKNVESDNGFKFGTVTEVRIIARARIDVNMDLLNTQWHGKNLVIWTDELHVTKVGCVWDVSGFDQKSTFSVNAGTDDKGDGLDGADGQPGESGGNVFVKAETVHRGIQLKIISNGGQGGAGQDGGDGMHGVNGKSVSKEDFAEFPGSADTNYDDGYEHFNSARKAVKAKSRGTPIIMTDNGSRWGYGYMNATLQNGFTLTYLNYELLKCLTLLKGTAGTVGGKGGKQGIGGEGGFPGQIELDIPRNSNIQTENLKGNAGREGDGGYFGRNGIKGADMGRLYWVEPNKPDEILFGVVSLGVYSLYEYIEKNVTGDIISTYYGEAKNQYLELFKFSKDHKDAVWCTPLNCYVKILSAGNKSENSAVKVYQQRNNAKQLRQRQKHALAIRQRALNVTQIQQKYKSTFAETHVKVSTIKQVKMRAEKKIAEKVEQEIKFTKNISAENKKPSYAKIEVVEAASTDLVKINPEYEVNDLTEMINAKYEAFEKIGLEELPLPVIDVNEVKTIPEKCQQFLRLKPINDKIAPHELLLILNNALTNRERYAKDLKPHAFSDENKCDSVIREFVNEVNQDDRFADIKGFTDGYLTKFKNFSKHQLNLKLAFAEKYDRRYGAQKVDKDAFVAELSEISKGKFEDWNIIRKNETVMSALFTHFVTCTRDCPTFLELVALSSSINIRVYEKDLLHNRFLLKSNYNANSNAVMYLTNIEERFYELELDESRYKFYQYQKHTQEKWRQVINEIEELKSPTAIQSYVNDRTYAKEIRRHTNTSPLYHFVTSGNVSFIVELFADNHANSVKEKLETLVQIGANSTLHYIADRIRNARSPNVTIRDVTLVINTVLQLHQLNQQFATIDWILVTRKPEEWIVYMTLIRLENYFHEKLENRSMWETYLKKVTNKNIIIIFCLKLSIAETNTLLDVNQVDTLLYLLSVSEPDVMSIFNLKLQEWTYVLKEFYWKYKLKQCVKWQTDDQFTQKATHLLLRIESKNQFNTTNSLIDAFCQMDVTSSEEDKNLFIEIMKKFADDAWNITNDIVSSIKSTTKLSEVTDVIQKSMPDPHKTRSMDELMKLMKDQLSLESASGNSSLHIAQKKIFDQLFDVRKKLEDAVVFRDSITKWTVADLQNNYHRYSKIEERLGMIDHAIYLLNGWHYRDTQKLSVLTAVKNPKILFQIGTGEGKSVIVAAVAIMRVLDGLKVDVITSSKVLAERDAQDIKSLYDVFKITVSHNGSDNSSTRKAAYLSNVVYGDLSNFQRDYLLDQFYHEGIRGNRQYSIVLIDEVDSMLLDKGNTTLYLSHEIPELDKLEAIYLHIWTRVTLALTTNKGRNSLWNTKFIASEVKKSLYGLIDDNDIRQLARNIDVKHISQVLEMLRNEHIIDQNDFLVDNDDDYGTIRSKLAKHSEFAYLIDALLVLIQQRNEREKFITAPKYLKFFILENLNRWIDNAKLALYLKDRDDYVIDIDRHDKESKDAVVTIIDKDTGTDQVNSQWDSCLHQFIQLKHGCRLTPQSLKAVFISNVSYFKKYTLLNGMSGTLGSEVERQHLVDTHAVNFLAVPTFKQKRFSEDIPIVESSPGDWVNALFTETMKKINTGRSVLLICETVNAVEHLFKTFEKKLGKKDTIKKYTRDYEKLDVFHNEKNKLAPGYILIATNLAGRGTDLKLDKKLLKAGGLHVIVTYLTANDRVEQQAMGRAARKGEPGSGQLVVHSDEFTESSVANYRTYKLKSQRRIQEAEHISKVRRHYEDQIKYEEECFLRFNAAWEKNRTRLNVTKDGEQITSDDEDRKVPAKIQKILERGVLDKWAFWLDTHLGHDRNTDKSTIYAKMDAFVNTITNFGVEADDWHLWVDPLAQLVSLGTILAKDKETVAHSIRLFDRVVSNEPDFCEGALYYRALPLFQLDGKSKMIASLERARKMFETRKEYCETARGIIANVKERTANIDSQSVAFEDQQQRVMSIQDTFRKSIDDIIGHYADERLLEATDVSKYETKYAMRKLRNVGGLIGDAILDLSLMDHSFKRYCESKGADFTVFKTFMLTNADKVHDIPALLGAFKHSKVHMPNREDFWNILEGAQILNDTKTLYHIDMSEIEVVDPSFNQTLMNERKRPESFETHLYLYPEFNDSSNNYLTFEESVFKRLVPAATRPYLERHNCFSINKCAMIDMKKLKDHNFDQFGSIEISDLETPTLSDKIATEVVQALIGLGVLEKASTTSYKPTEKYFTFDFERPDIAVPSLYMDMVQQKLEICFAYVIAAHHLLKAGKCDHTTKVQLHPRVHEAIVSEMIAREIISPSKVLILPDKLEDTLRNIFDGQVHINDLSEMPSINRNMRVVDELKRQKYLFPASYDTYEVRKVISDSDKFRVDVKSVRVLLNTIHKLHTKEYITKLSEALREKRGTFNVIKKNLEIIAQPLSEFTELEAKDEEQQFKINGQFEILIGQEIKQEESFTWLAVLLVVFSVVLICVGVALAYFGGLSLGLLLIGAGIALLVMSLIFLNSTLSLANVRQSKEASYAQKAIQFVKEILNNIHKCLLWQEQHETVVSKNDEQFKKVVSIDIQKFNYVKRTSQFEDVINEKLNGLTEKIMGIMKREITYAVENANVRDDIRFLYETFNWNLVNKEIHKIDDFVLSSRRFALEVEPSMAAFKVEIIGNIDKKTKEMGVDSVKSVSAFRKTLQGSIEDGIKLFEGKRSVIFEILEKNVLGIYKECLANSKTTLKNMKEDQFENILPITKTNKLVESKSKGILDSLVTSAESLLNKIKHDIQAEVKQVVLHKLNALINKQIRNMSGLSDVDVIDLHEPSSLQQESIKQSLIENEYNSIVAKIKTTTTTTTEHSKECEHITSEGFEDLKNTLVTKKTKSLYNTIIERNKDIFGINLQIFANQSSNWQLIDNVVSHAIASPNSLVIQFVKNEIDSLIYALLVRNNRSSYHVVTRKLHEIYQHQQVSNCLNDLYKLGVLSTIEHSNKEWINAFQRGVSGTPSEMGVIRLKNNDIVLAATHNFKKPFIWETFKLFDDTALLDVTVVAMWKDVDETSPLSVKWQLLKYLEINYDLEDLPQEITLHLNGTTKVIKSSAIRSIIAEHPNVRHSVEGTHVTRDAIQAIDKFKAYLVELQDIILYLECNPDKFEKMINEMRGAVDDDSHQEEHD